MCPSVSAGSLKTCFFYFCTPNALYPKAHLLIFCCILALSPKFSPRGWELGFHVAWCLIDAGLLRLHDVLTDAVVMEWDTPAEADLVSSWPVFLACTVALQLFFHHIFPLHYHLRGFCVGGFSLGKWKDLLSRFAPQVSLFDDTSLEFRFTFKNLKWLSAENEYVTVVYSHCYWCAGDWMQRCIVSVWVKICGWVFNSVLIPLKV